MLVPPPRHLTGTQRAILVARHAMLMSYRNRKGEVNPKYKATAEKEGVNKIALTAAYYLIYIVPRPEKVEALMKEGGTVEVLRSRNGVLTKSRTKDVIVVAKDVKRSLTRTEIYDSKPIISDVKKESVSSTARANTIPNTYTKTELVKDVVAIFKSITELSAKCEKSKELQSIWEMGVTHLKKHLELLEMSS